jgi:DNA-binding MarR family transcriptional regulator
VWTLQESLSELNAVAPSTEGAHNDHASNVWTNPRRYSESEFAINFFKILNDCTVVSRLEKQYSLNQKTIKSFMDMIILNHLKNNPLVSGYEIMMYLHKKFDVLVSPGTIYSALYSLERHNLVEANNDQGKRTYRLTKKGEREIHSMKDNIDAVLSSIFS